MFKISTRKTIIALIFAIVIAGFVVREAWQREHGNGINNVADNSDNYPDSINLAQDEHIKNMLAETEILPNISKNFQQIDIFIQIDYHSAQSSLPHDVPYKYDFLKGAILPIEKTLSAEIDNLLPLLPESDLKKEIITNRISIFEHINSDNFSSYSVRHNERKAIFQYLFNLMNISTEFQDSESENNLVVPVE